MKKSTKRERRLRANIDDAWDQILLFDTVLEIVRNGNWRPTGQVGPSGHDIGYTARELMAATGVDERTIGAVLHELQRSEDIVYRPTQKRYVFAGERS